MPMRRPTAPDLQTILTYVVSNLNFQLSLRPSMLLEHLPLRLTSRFLGSRTFVVFHYHPNYPIPFHSPLGVIPVACPCRVSYESLALLRPHRHNSQPIHSIPAPDRTLVH